MNSRIQNGHLFSVDEVYGIFVDGFVADDMCQLVFISLWGRDTAIQELLARLTISVAEGGLETLSLRNTSDNKLHSTLWIKERNALEKMTARMPKDNLFGEIAHLWLFDRLLKEPDRANHTGYYLSLTQDEVGLWQLLRETCHIPLLDHWQLTVLDSFREQGWISDCRLRHQVFCTRIAIDSEEVELHIGNLVRAGNLTLYPAL